MAEEIKQEEKAAESKNVLSMIIKVGIGLALIVLGGVALWTWGSSFLELLKGSIGLFLVLAGIITLAIAKE